MPHSTTRAAAPTCNAHVPSPYAACVTDELPTPLPPGPDDDGMQRLPLAALRVDQGYAGTLGMILPTFVGLGAGTLVGAAVDAPFWGILLGLIGIWITWFPFRVFVVAPIQWSRFRYRIEPEFVRIRRGVFIHRHTLVPLVRVQNVDTAQGPLERRFGLSDVQLHNAATTHSIPNLETEVAEALREQLAELVRRARDDD